MAEPVWRQWSALQQSFASDAPEWGGTRLLLRVMPGTSGHPFDRPPFDGARVHFDHPIPAEYPVTVLRLDGRDHVACNPNRPECGLAADGPCTLGSARWWIFWFGSHVGWDRFRNKASIAGRLAADLPEDVRHRLRRPPLDPIAVEDDAARWLAVLMCMAYGTPAMPGQMRFPQIVDLLHRWLDIPRNRGEREQLARQHPGAVGEAILREPPDDYTLVLPSEVYTASAGACSSFSWQVPRKYTTGTRRLARRRRRRIGSGTRGSCASY